MMQSPKLRSLSFADGDHRAASVIATAQAPTLPASLSELSM